MTRNIEAMKATNYGKRVFELLNGISVNTLTLSLAEKKIYDDEYYRQSGDCTDDYIAYHIAAYGEEPTWMPAWSQGGID